MKKWLCGLMCLLAVCTGRPANVYFDLADFQLTYLNFRNVSLTPQTMPSVTGTNVVTRDRRTQTTSVAGRVTFTNVVAGTYLVSIQGPNAITTFSITVTNTSATLNGKDLISDPPTAAEGQFVRITGGVANTVRFTNTPVDGYVLTSTNNGLAVWMPAAGGVGGGTPFIMSSVGKGTNTTFYVAITNQGNLYQMLPSTFNDVATFNGHVQIMAPGTLTAFAHGSISSNLTVNGTNQANWLRVTNGVTSPLYIHNTNGPSLVIGANTNTAANILGDINNYSLLSVRSVQSGENDRNKFGVIAARDNLGTDYGGVYGDIRTNVSVIIAETFNGAGQHKFSAGFDSVGSFLRLVGNSQTLLDAADDGQLTASSNVIVGGNLVQALGNTDGYFMMSSNGGRGVWAPAVSQISTPATLWVSPNGNDAQAVRGRMDKPWGTISNAVWAAQNGDTVKIFPGDYTNNLNYFPTFGYAILCWNKTNVVIEGSGPGTRLFGTNSVYGAGALGGFIQVSECQNVTWRDMQIIGNKGAGSMGAALTNGLVYTIEVNGAGSKNLTFERLVLKNHPNHGLSVRNENCPSDVIVRHCWFENGGASNGVPALTRDGPAIQISGHRWTVVDNVITNWLRGIEGFSGVFALQDSVVSRNFISPSWQGLALYPGAGLPLRNWVVSENTIFGNATTWMSDAQGIVIAAGGAERCLFKGNVVVNFPATGEGLNAVSSHLLNNTVLGNLFHGMGKGMTFWDGLSVTTNQAHNLIVENQFSDIGGNGIDFNGTHNVVARNVVRRFNTNGTANAGIRSFSGNTNSHNGIFDNVIVDGNVGILLLDAGVVTNRVFDNHVLRCTTEFTDNGTGTLIRRWAAGASVNGYVLTYTNGLAVWMPGGAGGGGDITGGNVNQFTENAGILTLKSNAFGTNLVFFYANPGEPATNVALFGGELIGGGFGHALMFRSAYNEDIPVITLRTDPSATVSNILYFGGQGGAIFAEDHKLAGRVAGNTDPRFVWNFMDENDNQQSGVYLRQSTVPGNSNVIWMEAYAPDIVGNMNIWMLTNAAMYLGPSIYPTVVKGNSVTIASNANFMGLVNVFTNRPRVAFYVDSVNGSDSNDGRQPGAAFKTISKLTNTIGSVPNNHEIRLARGSHWRTNNLRVGSNVVVGAYGAGPKPILNASAHITNILWQKVGGLVNTYAISNHQVSQSGYIGVAEDGVLLIKTNSIANVDASPGTFFAPEPPVGGFATNEIFIHPRGSTVATNDAKMYEVGAVGWGLFCGDDCVVEDIETRGPQLSANGSFEIGRRALVRRCDFINGNKHNMLFGSGVLEFCTAKYQEYNNQSATLFVHFWPTTENLKAIYRGCVAECDPQRITANSFFGHTSDGGGYELVIVEDCIARYCTAAGTPGINTNGLAIFNRCYSEDAGGWACGAGTNIVIDCVGVVTPRVPAAAASGYLSFTGRNSWNWISGFRGFGREFGVRVEETNVSLRVLDSVFVGLNSSGSGSGHSGIYLSPGTNFSLSISNTIIANFGNAYNFIGGSNTVIAAATNCFDGISGWTVNGVSYIWGDYQTAFPGRDVGSDTNILQNLGNMTRGDLRLANTSPAVTNRAGGGYWASRIPPEAKYLSQTLFNPSLENLSIHGPWLERYINSSTNDLWRWKLNRTNDTAYVFTISRSWTNVLADVIQINADTNLRLNLNKGNNDAYANEINLLQSGTLYGVLKLRGTSSHETMLQGVNGIAIESYAEPLRLYGGDAGGDRFQFFGLDTGTLHGRANSSGDWFWSGSHTITNDLTVRNTVTLPDGAEIIIGGSGATVTNVLSATATLDFASTAAQTSADLTVTVTRAADGDAVVVTPPNGSVNANSCFTGWVSAANTVTVRFNNYSAAAIDPASGSFRVMVTKFQ